MFGSGQIFLIMSSYPPRRRWSIRQSGESHRLHILRLPAILRNISHLKTLFFWQLFVEFGTFIFLATIFHLSFVSYANLGLEYQIFIDRPVRRLPTLVWVSFSLTLLVNPLLVLHRSTTTSLDPEARLIRHIGKLVTSEPTWQTMPRRSYRHPVRHLAPLLPLALLHLQQLAVLPPHHYDFRIWLCRVLFYFLLWRCFPNDSRSYHLDVSMIKGICCIQIGHGEFLLDLCRTTTVIPTPHIP